VKKILAFLVTLIASVATAQSPVTVSATVISQNNIPYANGTVIATLVDANGNDLSASPVIIGGQPITVPQQQGNMNSVAFFTFQLLPNTAFTSPTGTQWLFKICSQNPASYPPGTTIVPQRCFTYTTTIAAAVDLSVPLHAIAPPLQTTGGGAANPAGSDCNIQYNASGVFGANAALCANELNGAIRAPNIPINVLSYDGPGTNVDPTCNTDSTAGVQAALNVANNATSPTMIFFPHGCYLIDNATSLLLTQGAGNPSGAYIGFYGEGDASIIRGGASITSSINLIQVIGTFKVYIHDITIECFGCRSNLQFLVNATGRPNNQPTVQNVTFNPLATSGTNPNSTYDVTWEHANGFDHNNDFAQMINDSAIGCNTACYLITGGNAVFETFIGGHIAGAEGWITQGGSFKAIGVSGGTSGTTGQCIIDQQADSQSGDAGYQYGSSAQGLNFEGSACIYKGASGVGVGTFQMKDIKCKCGPSTSSGAVIDWESTGDFASFSLHGAEINTPNGGTFTFASAGSPVLLEEVEANINSISYGANLTMIGNTWNSNIGLPTLISTGAGLLCRIGDMMVGQPVPNTCNFPSVYGGIGPYSNLILCSEFQPGCVSNWAALQSPTLTANTTDLLTPFLDNTAEKIVVSTLTASTTGQQQNFNVTVGHTYIASVWIASNSGNSATLNPQINIATTSGGGTCSGPVDVGLPLLTPTAGWEQYFTLPCTWITSSGVAHFTFGMNASPPIGSIFYAWFACVQDLASPGICVNTTSSTLSGVGAIGAGQLLATTAQLPLVGTVTLTAATSDAATVTGVTSAGHCWFAATNATAAANTVTPSIGTPTTNSVTITHVATTASGGTMNVFCTPY
jgi:hypothetical protein